MGANQRHSLLKNKRPAETVLLFGFMEMDIQLRKRNGQSFLLEYAIDLFVHCEIDTRVIRRVDPNANHDVDR